MNKNKPVQMKYCGERDKKVIIVFPDDAEDGIWEHTVAEDFMKGYSEKDADYDKL
ncbi:MAG: hypothetical protein K8F52_08780 [Candidatus Scalindua rubra]|uniref:Uncharacterized protein n=1 Tax=Candidatus Scalindua brodae TaxID=237368 RepID=A0A0B0EPB7_9BACT|nr:MAG: hypothetical protein SCABRO_01782 [Candidatus Scalindua brodae]MBZ0108753.1 hypothetical protein [Candidatus Scalindua rubra]TWU36460.1 hypothetical protein S225a_07390 [Candidatus Brocadiaceae bacterium S225]